MTMSDPLERWKRFALNDACDVVRTVIVVKGADTYRIEVLRSYSRPVFRAQVWIERNADLRGHGEADRRVERVLVEYDMPLTEDENADVLLTRALRYLAEDVHAE